jgi:hypothetical protein
LIRQPVNSSSNWEGLIRQELLREIATSHLVPLFSGARLETEIESSRSRSNRVVVISSEEIGFKVDREDTYRLVLSRPQPFAHGSENIVPEIAVVSAFVDVLAEMKNVIDGPLKQDLLSTIQRRIVATAVGSSRSSSVLSGIDLLSRWANRLYEGAPIASAIGFRLTSSPAEALTLSDFESNDFGAIIGNGHDTLLEFNFEEKFIGHRCLDYKNVLPPFCPYRQAPIAGWTTKDERRVALILNRIGEILVLRNQQLLFARRSARWHFLTHQPILEQMRIPRDADTREAVYETCLDASFARTGACIGIVSDSRRQSVREVVVELDDYIGEGKSEKARAMTKIISTKKFHELDRRLRQEMVAIDGATVISSDGDVLAVGSIVKIPGGSTGGGRLAAARALARLGLGIKVSQDGAIKGFRLSREEPEFRVM